MRTGVSLAALALVCGAGAGPSSAGEHEGRDKARGHGRTFEGFLERHDRDRDGLVSRDELSHNRAFTRLDQDEDGVVTQAEIDRIERPRGKEHAAKWLAKADSNHDGRVSAQEAGALRSTHFDKLDANRDGKVDKREFEAARAAHGPRTSGGSGPDAGIDEL